MQWEDTVMLEEEISNYTNYIAVSHFVVIYGE